MFSLQNVVQECSLLQGIKKFISLELTSSSTKAHAPENTVF
jgi:hypothetical protein